MRWSVVVGLTLLWASGCMTSPAFLFEEAAIVVHSKIDTSGCHVALDKVKGVIQKLEKFTLETDLLSKVDMGMASSWENYKVSVVARLRAKVKNIDVWADSLFGIDRESYTPPTIQTPLTSKTGRTETNVNRLNNDLTHDYNNDITITKYKMKRSINALGNLLSYLTGVPGPDDWKQNVANVESLKKAIETVNQKVDLTDTRIDLNQNAITELHKDLTTIIKTIDLELTENEYLKDGLKVRLVFATVEKEALKVLEMIESMFYKLEMVMILGRHRFASRFGISAQYLTAQLRDIESTSKVLRPLYGVKEIDMYYRHPLCSMALVGRDLWLSLKIPLVNFSKILREVPKATYTNQINRLTKLGETNPRLLKSDDGTYSIIGAEKERDCLKLTQYTLCEGKRINMKAYHVDGIAVIKSFWSEISRNTLAFYDLTNITVAITCLTKRYLVKLPLQGILRLEPGCELVSDPITITEHVTWIGEKTFVNPTFVLNEVDDTKFDRLTFDQTTHDAKLNISVKLDKKINDLTLTILDMNKNQKSFTNNHDDLRSKINSTTQTLHERINNIHWDLNKNSIYFYLTIMIVIFTVGAVVIKLLPCGYRFCDNAKKVVETGNDHRHTAV
jgi:prefoldin subunit 5